MVRFYTNSLFAHLHSSLLFPLFKNLLREVPIDHRNKLNLWKCDKDELLLKVFKIAEETSGNHVSTELIGPWLLPWTQLIRWKHSTPIFNYLLKQAPHKLTRKCRMNSKYLNSPISLRLLVFLFFRDVIIALLVYFDKS